VTKAKGKQTNGARKLPSLTPDDIALLSDLWTIGNRLADVAKGTRDPVWAKATIEAARVIQPAVENLLRVAGGRSGGVRFVASGYRVPGEPDDREKIYEELVRRVRDKMADQPVDLQVSNLLIALSFETAGMGEGAPGLEDERFAVVAEDALRRIGKGKKSDDPAAIVRACMRAIGVKDQLGKNERQRASRQARAAKATRVAKAKK
jgi:hypothetical protein